MSLHDTKELRKQILRMISDQLGPRMCPGCATEAIVNVLAGFMDCAIDQQDKALLDVTATALEFIASQCRQMKPIAGSIVPAGKPH